MSLKNLFTTTALLASLLGASSVFAHAHLKGSNPAANSSVVAPNELRLMFSEGVEAAFTQVTISKDGAPLEVKSLATEGTDKKTLVVTPAATPLRAGEYKVEWHAVSVDTHKSEGSYSFKVSP
ncbi:MULTISPECIES: copper homeostasis periplasmic binding protein CopC [Pseudomonas]|uniref:Copper resistance protein C n=1 Tax=Pseudomonas idahonensis TaxID=2942628 RepID=A0ABT5QA43_9PSED|nr:MULTISPECIES: copper homeostasis periplasmic binding protein CopC [Pseudomonas]MCO7578543.1 copper homeostasis periplasmic binding protein CopC [Pseudomonas protegens]MCO7585467.1 copper homeostasis periplasmic binding protein CopC [Pseudomonas chlororaphis]MCO7601889.1 copper homeostasis periplasmic binding protein CopC [Pseudomonas chlororaphis]MDC7817721.1 copper homeostasis periplasmic binding protein CopC [Pseudomonas sp. BLCC-B112]MDD1151076.1 copper homeostasis periplasmic binding pr